LIDPQACRANCRRWIELALQPFIKTDLRMKFALVRELADVREETSRCALHQIALQCGRIDLRLRIPANVITLSAGS
jgi:hypothetical protein